MSSSSSYRIVYSSDLHGNSVQYQKLVAYACDVNADAIILGGDLAPKGLPHEEFIPRQRAFFREELSKLLLPFKKLLGKRIFLTMGNDDCEALISDFVSSADGVYESIMNRRVVLNDQFEIVGYPFVPIHPFGMKDWQKFDLSIVPLRWETVYRKLKKENYRYDGLRTNTGDWSPYRFTVDMEKSDSIQYDLEQELFTQNPRQTVYVMHSPPFGTALDITSQGDHVGSIAERIFIERHQPYLTLHGHIHETVSMSGRFVEQIGGSRSMSSGNHNVGKKVALLDFDLADLARVKRVRI